MNKARQTVFEIMDEMKPGTTFTGYGLMLRVEMLTGEKHFPDTCLRYVRTYRQRTGRIIKNIDKKKSVYEVVA